MSWNDKLTNISLTIITGDGNTYMPKWIGSIKNIKYNVEGFDFIGKLGTYVSREEQSGAQYPLELYFDSENHLDISDAFEISARDKRPWTIKHPYFSEFKAQPLSLEIDRSFHGVTKVMVTVWETIADKYPASTVNVSLEIQNLKTEIDENNQNYFVEKLPTPETSLINKCVNSVSSFGTNYANLPSTAEGSLALKNLIRSSSAVARSVVSAPDTYISQINDLINFPFEIESNIVSSLRGLQNTINELKTTLLGLNHSPGSEILYEAIGTMAFTTACVLTVVNKYAKRDEIAEVSTLLLDLRNSFNSGFEDYGYLNDADNARRLDYTYNKTQVSLSVSAFEAKQARKYTLNQPSNIILEAHKYYGSGDEKLDEFITQNNIQLNEFIEIPEGRELIYYV